MNQPWMQTYTRRHIVLSKIGPLDIDLRDIAHALSMQCRFNGHSKKFYSIAEHSILMHNLVRPEYALEALLHDAVEAYIGDIITPLKHYIPEIKTIERRIDRVIRSTFNLPSFISPEVKAADLFMLATESEYVMSGQVQDWELHVTPLARVKFNFWTPKKVERIFLRMAKTHISK